MKKQLREVSVTCDSPFEMIKGKVLEIPIVQISEDPHQPRVKFNGESLNRLSDDIQDQGPKQIITVNFSSRDGELNYFTIRGGARRFRSYKMLHLKTVRCAIELTYYDGKKNFKRRLNQAAENSLHEPNTLSEIIELYREALEEAGGKGVKTSQATALKTLAKGFKTNIAWAKEFAMLANLEPIYISMLDEGVLSRESGVKLASVSKKERDSIYDESLSIQQKSGAVKQYAFINKEVRKVREGRGERISGPRPTDYSRLEKVPEGLHKVIDRLTDGMSPNQAKEILIKKIDSLRIMEIDPLLTDFKSAMEFLNFVLERIQKRRNILYGNQASR